MFHLGKSGEDYFYAMEYVEGETLEDPIKRCGRLEPKIALEIMSQVAAGLAAIHELVEQQRGYTISLRNGSIPAMLEWRQLADAADVDREVKLFMV